MRHVWVVLMDCRESGDCNRCGSVNLHLDCVFRTKKAARAYVRQRKAEDGYIGYQILKMEVC